MVTHTHIQLVCASAPVEVVVDALYLTQFGGGIHHGVWFTLVLVALSIG